MYRTYSKKRPQKNRLAPCFLVVGLMVFSLYGQAHISNAPGGHKDNPAAVTALEKSGAIFEKDSEGRIIGVDFVLNPISNDSLAFLKGLPDLTRVTFICTPKVTDEGLVHLKGLSKITYLKFGHSMITDQGLVHLKDLTNLKELHIGSRNSHFQNDGLKYLRNLKNLRRLTFSKTTNVTKEDINELKRYLPDCKIRKEE